MAQFTEIITQSIAGIYHIAEIIQTPPDKFVYILYHSSKHFPAIHAKVSWMRGTMGYFVCFDAKPLREGFVIDTKARDYLEFNLVNVAGELRKCMFANYATKWI